MGNVKAAEVTTHEVSPSLCDSADEISLVNMKGKNTVETIERIQTETSLRDEDGEKIYKAPAKTAHDLVTEVLRVEDDPTLSPWTFRTWFLGIGIALFASSTTAINSFKAHPMHLSTIFVAVLSYLLGETMARLIPRKGIFRYLNPGPFNSKEHAAICIFASSAASMPEAMMVLSVQRLYYNIIPKPAAAVFMVMSVQMLGYGVAGLLRSTLVYPTNMLWPQNLPTAALIDNLHRDRHTTRRRMRIFYYGFVFLFVWSAFPQYIMPITGGISIFCLANRDNMVITRLFGGIMSNEGLGFLSISLDWQTIAGFHNPLWLPLQTLLNELVGVSIGVGLLSAFYYSNVWHAKSMPFLSPMLYSPKSTSKHYVPFNQSSIMHKNHTVNHALVEKNGLPYYTTSYAVTLTVTNIAIMATIVHLLLWHYADMKSVWAFFNKDFFRSLLRPSQWNWKFWKVEARTFTPEEAEAIDPHFALMQKYKEVPNWWFGIIFVVSAAMSLLCINEVNSTLPWWGFFAAIAVMTICIPFFSAMTALTGFSIIAQPLVQIISAYMIPGRPLANMYFGVFSFNSMMQAKHLLSDLKLGQYVHLNPRCTFTMQVLGTMLGSVVSYLVSQDIVESKREILLAIQGTNVWSGQMLQSINTGAVAWGGLAKHLFSFGGRYYPVALGFFFGIFLPIPFWLLHRRFPKLRLDYWNMSIIAGSVASLGHGTHTGLLMHFVIGFISQLWLRKYRPNWFIKYNYILSAGLDGGMSVINFILTFSVLGAGGRTVDFPPYWGNNYQKGNYDFCMKDPGLGGGKRGHEGLGAGRNGTHSTGFSAGAGLR